MSDRRPPIRSRQDTRGPARGWSPGLLRRWAPLIILSLVALTAWKTADVADVDAASSEPVVFENTLTTPVLSVRRIPQTIQAPIALAALTPELSAIIDQSPETTCLVVHVEGRDLLDHGALTAVVPASNQKLVSTFAALGVLGPDAVFRTAVRTDEPPVDGVIEGNVYLVGGGDPFLATDDWWSQYTSQDGRAHTRLEDLADQLTASGITTITGSVVGDESRYDRLRTGDWAQRLVDSRQSGPLSALAVNQGYVSWPETFAGSFRPRQPATDPAADAARVLTELLQAGGVTVGGAPTSGTASPTAVEIGGINSPPLIDLITHINSYSDNFGAELVVKELGLQAAGEGSTATGVGVITEYLSGQGLPLEGVRIVDGSGLSEANTVTCDLLVALLDAAGPDSAFVASLSIGGERGSLAGRHQGTPAEGQLFGKTGTLNDVTALSGVVESIHDEDIELTFSYIVNGELVGQSEEVRDLQIPLVEALARYPDAPGLIVLAPLAVNPVTTTGTGDPADGSGSGQGDGG